MSPRRPEVFVSATSADLCSCRQLVKEGLLTLGCVPVEQVNFPPDYRRVRDMLRSRIAACDAVIHLAGESYGAEPDWREGGGPRRSYTQLEYDLARELRKPLYVFLCNPGFAYDHHPPEDAAKHRLQQAHRAALSMSETLRCEVGSRVDLALRVRELQTCVEHLTDELKKTRSWLSRGVAAAVALLMVLSGGLWWLNQHGVNTERRVARLETEFERQRRYLKAVADAFAQPVKLESLQLADEERFNRAVTAVAQRERLPETDFRRALERFIVAVRSNPKADVADRALADFAQEKSARAAAKAGQIAGSVSKPRLATDRFTPITAARAEESAANRPKPPSTINTLPPGGAQRTFGLRPTPASAATDRETLRLLVAQITPSGVVMLRGAPSLIFANKRFEVGTRFTASYNNQDYELELVAIDRTTFTLRYRGEEITRPIKPEQ